MHKSHGQNSHLSFSIIHRISRTPRRVGTAAVAAGRSTLTGPGFAEGEIWGKAAHHENSPKTARSKSLLPLSSTWRNLGAAKSPSTCCPDRRRLETIAASASEEELESPAAVQAPLPFLPAFLPLFSLSRYAPAEAPVPSISCPPHGFPKASLLFANIF